MLTFNQLLRASDVDPDDVRLVRHRDPNVQRAVFDARAGYRCRPAGSP
jgi:hypothetical protein